MIILHQKNDLCIVIKYHESSVTENKYETIYNSCKIKQNSLHINLPSDNKKRWSNKKIPNICMNNILQYLEIENIISLSKTNSITHKTIIKLYERSQFY